MVDLFLIISIVNVCVLGLDTFNTKVRASLFERHLRLGKRRMKMNKIKVSEGNVLCRDLWKMHLNFLSLCRCAYYSPRAR